MVQKTLLILGTLFSFAYLLSACSRLNTSNVFPGGKAPLPTSVVDTTKQAGSSASVNTASEDNLLKALEKEDSGSIDREFGNLEKELNSN